MAKKQEVAQTEVPTSEELITSVVKLSKEDKAAAKAAKLAEAEAKRVAKAHEDALKTERKKSYDLGLVMGNTQGYKAGYTQAIKEALAAVRAL